MRQLDGVTGEDYPYGIFVSHPLKRYGTASPRVFYYGRDTNTWMANTAKGECGGFDGMMALFRSGKLEEYLRQNNWPHDPSEMLAWGDLWTFWPFVVRLHLFLAHDIWVDSVHDIKKNMLPFLEEIGYGNVHSVEVGSGIDKSRLGYKGLVKAVEPLDRLKLVLDAYSPDVVVVLTWDWDDGSFLSDLEYASTPMEIHRGHHRWRTCRFLGYSTRLVCLDHPQAFKFRRADFEGMVRETVSVLNSY